MLQGWIQIIVFAAVLFAIVPLLGGYMARVFTNERAPTPDVEGLRGSLLVFSACPGSRCT